MYARYNCEIMHNNMIHNSNCVTTYFKTRRKSTRYPTPTDGPLSQRHTQSFESAPPPRTRYRREPFPSLSRTGTPLKRTALLIDLAQLTTEIAGAIFTQTSLTDAATIACAIALALALDVLLRIIWPHDNHEETDDNDNED